MSRDHFVYRVFDEHDVLLYIGVTSQPDGRWRQHRGRSAWAAYAARFKLSGPFEKDVAYRMEATAIGTEAPFFNATRSHGQEQQDRASELLRTSQAEHPELWTPAVHGTEPWRFEMRHMRALLDQEFPTTLAGRCSLYLDQRRRRVLEVAS